MLQSLHPIEVVGNIAKKKKKSNKRKQTATVPSKPRCKDATTDNTELTHLVSNRIDTACFISHRDIVET